MTPRVISGYSSYTSFHIGKPYELRFYSAGLLSALSKWDNRPKSGAPRCRDEYVMHNVEHVGYHPNTSKYRP